MTSNGASGSVCPISDALSIIGDRWTILILIELALGVHRFEEIQAQIGASPFLLSTRLKRLHKHGIIERRAYSERPPRYEYYATAKGRGIDPIIISYLKWGVTWENHQLHAEPAMQLLDTKSDRIVDFTWPIAHEDLHFGDNRIKPLLSEQYMKERAFKRAAFFSGRRTPRKS